MKAIRFQVLVFVCGLFIFCLQGRAATLQLGQVATGNIASAASSNSYTFTGSVGEVIDLTMTTTSGTLAPKIQLYSPSATLLSTADNFDCGAAPVEMNTVMLPSAGTYTVIVSDCNSTNTGNYNLYSQSTNSPVGAASLPFDQTVPGAIGSAALSNTYTFSATASDVIDITMTTTSGSLAPKIRLYNPNGELNTSSSNFDCGAAPVEMNTVTLPSTGTYVVLVGDCGDINTGSYEIYAQFTNAPIGGVILPLLFGQSQPGSVTAAAESNTYTFSANASDVLDITMTTTSGSLAPKIRLYNPNGELNTSSSNFDCGAAPVEMNTVTLPSTGTYTVLVGDCSDTNTGNYEIYSQRTNNPSRASALSIGQTMSGLIASAAKSNTYAFSANANDVLDVTMTTTSGSLAPKIRLYNPNGELNTSSSNFDCGAAPVEMNTVTLPSTGTYTVLVGDCSDTNTGNYEIYSQRTNKPVGGVDFVFGGTAQPGTIGTATQSNTYTFGGTAGATVTFSMTITSGSLAPKLRLYNPDGSLAASASNFDCGSGPLSLNSGSLTQTGLFTLLAGDCSDTNNGNYNVSGQCIGSCTTVLNTPTVTVTPSSSYITTAQAVPVTVTVSGGPGSPTPTGSVTLSGGGYTSSPATLSGGSVNFNIPAGSLTLGNDTLTASYSPDAGSSSTYNSATGADPVTVVQSTYACITANPNPNPNPQSFAAGGDFNGDCRSDILWRNTSTEQVYEWLMNGTTYTGQRQSRQSHLRLGHPGHRRFQWGRLRRYPVAEQHHRSGLHLAHERHHIYEQRKPRVRLVGLEHRGHWRLQRRWQSRYPVAQQHDRADLRLVHQRNHDVGRRERYLHHFGLGHSGHWRFQRRWHGRHPVAEQHHRSGLHLAHERICVDQQWQPRLRLLRLEHCWRRRFHW